jgi:hypothetical protein
MVMMAHERTVRTPEWSTALKPHATPKRRGESDYTRDTERKVERLLAELYDALNIHKPDDLFGSIVIETRYQNGRPVGQVDVNIKYIMKRVKDGEPSNTTR